MRRLPKFVRIMGQRMLITVVPDLVHKGTGDEHDERAYGVFYPDDPGIWLDKANGAERTKVTLVHECLHAMLNTSQFYDLPEEEVVSRMAPLLLDFIRANRGAIAYLQEN